MTCNPNLTEIFAAIDAADDLSSLQRVVFQIREMYSLTNTVFHLAHAPSSKVHNSLLLLTYPEDWVKIYINEDYFSIDPVVRRGLTGFLPIDWATLDWNSPRCSDFLKQANSFEIGRNGATLTIRGPSGERSLFSFTSNETGQNWITLRNLVIHDFQVIGHYLHNRVMLLSGARIEGNFSQLSKREKQCLELIAQGLLPKQISHRLTLSESAVRLYLSCCRRKLHTVSIAHAVGIAVSLELIAP